jgi:hypothetical protein
VVDDVRSAAAFSKQWKKNDVFFTTNGQCVKPVTLHFLLETQGTVFLLRSSFNLFAMQGTAMPPNISLTWSGC